MSAQQTGYPPDLSWELVIPTQWHQSGSCISTTNRRRAPCQVFFSGYPYTWHGYTHQFSAGFEPLLASSSNHRAWNISTSAYIILPNWHSHSLRTTHKTFALKQNTLLKQEGTVTCTGIITGPDSHCSAKGSPMPHHPLCAGLGEVCGRKQLFPKHLLLPQTPPPQPRHAYRLLQLCQKTRNASRKPFSCNHSWM